MTVKFGPSIDEQYAKALFEGHPLGVEWGELPEQHRIEIQRRLGYVVSDQDEPPVHAPGDGGDAERPKPRKPRSKGVLPKT